TTLFRSNTSLQSRPALIVQTLNATSTSTSTPPSSSSTPQSYPPPSNGIWGWVAISMSLYNAIYNASSTGSIPIPPFTYVNGYPTLNGNYLNCNGSID